MPNSDVSKVYIAFDYGLKHIGVAVGQTVTQTAKPLTSLKAQQGKPPWHMIQALYDEWLPHGFIVGEPLNMDGTPQAITHKARQFANALAKRFTQTPVHCVDERLSTIESREHLFAVGGYKALAKDRIDSYSAKLILETYLRSLAPCP